MLLASAQPVAASNSSDPAITVFAVQRPEGSQPLINQVIVGPDGAIWFTWWVEGSTPGSVWSGIGSVDSGGHLGTFAAPSGWVVEGLTSGGGSLWAAESHAGTQYVVQWAVSGEAGATFPIGGAGVVHGIAWGPDGALWFTAGASADSCGVQGGFIGRMTTGGAVTTFTLPAAGSGSDNGAQDIAPGADGALWFDLNQQGSIGRITTSGAINEFRIPGARTICSFVFDEDLTAGPAGAMWVGSDWTGGIQRVASDGTVTTFTGGSDPFSITAGGDGSLYFTAAFEGTVKRMTTSGQITTTWPLATQYPAGAPVIAAGPGGTLWIGIQGEIERLDPSVPPSGPTPVAPAATPTLAPATAGASTTEVTATPAPFNPDSPSPSAGTGAVASTHVRPSSGSGLGIVVGSVAAVVLLASGAAAIVIRRRHTTAAQAPPTP